MRAVWSCWFFGLAATLVAADKQPAETPALPAEDSIAAARRDLELIKAAKGSAAEQPRSGLPQFSGSEMQFHPTAQPRLTSPLTPAGAAAAKKSTNWLVDAMMKKPTGMTAEKGRLEDKSGLENEEVRSENETDERSRDPKVSSKADRQDARQSTEPIVNPLTNFMAGWMTPQDYKLLQSGMGAESPANLVARGEQASNTVFPGAGAVVPSGFSTVGKPTPGPGTQIPKENPFLQEFTAIAATASKPSAIPPAVIVNPPTAKASMPVPEPPPPRSTSPGFVKPNDDAKYFKPLKRF